MRAFAKLVQICAAFVAVLGLAFHPAHAMSVLPLGLDEIADGAETAFEGRCVANRSEVDPVTGFVVTYTTFEVIDALKGSPGTTHEIKQLGGELSGEGARYRVPGVPRFEVGRDYVVFLAGVSSAGFSSPIGLAQGRFGIEVRDGVRRVSNGRDFRDMAKRIAADAPPAARERIESSSQAVRDMDLEDFKQLVRGHLGTKR